jgi:hypothetical protein
LRAAGLRVEVHKDHFNSDADDDEWLPIVGSKGWIVLTKDRQISSRQVELVALLKSGAPSFVLTSRSKTAEQNAAAILKALPQIRGCLRHREIPFVAQITASGSVSILATRADLIKRIQ